jgi:hypothetical protein
LTIGADYEPPETATPEPDDELVGAGEACRPVEVVPVVVEDVVPEDVAVAAVAPDEVVAVPGIVYALTAPRMQTPAIAPKARPAVSRLSVLVAMSRARILVSEMFSFSMLSTMACCT